MKKTATRDMCEVAALIALTIILSHFASIKTDTIRIGFGFVPIALCGMLFGPVWAGVAYGIADMAGALLFYWLHHPGHYPLCHSHRGILRSVPPSGRREAAPYHRRCALPTSSFAASL